MSMSTARASLYSPRQVRYSSYKSQLKITKAKSSTFRVFFATQVTKTFPVQALRKLRFQFAFVFQSHTASKESIIQWRLWNLIASQVLYTWPVIRCHVPNNSLFKSFSLFPGLDQTSTNVVYKLVLSTN